VIHDWFAARNNPTMYRPYAQEPTRFVSVAVRTGRDPMDIVGAVRAAVHGVDTTRPLFDVMTMEQIISERIVGLRQITVVLATVGLLALLLATVGMYGLIAYLVSQRRSEIGLRLALGATAGDALRLVLGQASRLTLAGVVVGAVLALAVARLLESALVGVATFDFVLLLLVVLFVAVISLVAGYLPARRALAVPPSVALKNW
jgi:putative ABC transport system permease protein